MPLTYAELTGAVIPILDPHSLRGAPSDAEIATRRMRAAAKPAARRTAGLNLWDQYILDSVGAPLQGTGKGGAWTKADLEALIPAPTSE